ncbi:MAG: hypothetical protein R3C44_17490 [Chloroflexota bacterium]
MYSSYQPPEEYAGLDRTLRTIERFNKSAAVAAENGLQFGIHNHWWEFELLTGSDTRPYQVWLERLDPAVFFELDAYWAQVGGVAPLDALAALGSRNGTVACQRRSG